MDDLSSEPNEGAATHSRYETDPYQMTILANKFEAASRNMSQSLIKSARSGVISIARDFSSAITLYDTRQFMYDEGLPVHSANIQLIPQYTLDQFDDIQPGDCFLTNSPWAGNTHHADYTLHAPVFYEGDPIFWTINKAHQADCGAPKPTTYLAEAETVYEEGPHFPSVRIQREYEDVDDVVRILKHNLRLGENQWYGDYRAQVAAVRTGEKEIKRLCDEYGLETIMTFAEDWLVYGEEMMKSAIAELPKATVEHTSYHDSIPETPETADGIPVTVTVDIDPDEGRIEVDLTDNMDNIPAGMNLTEATALGSAYSGVFYNLDSEIPHNHGSAQRVDINLREGCIVGKPEFPVGTSVGTTNVADALINAVNGAFAKLGKPFGIAEGVSGNPPNLPVISGTDFRNDDEPYINQLILVGGGGPGVHGHDGWVTYGLPDNGGVLRRDSIELDEQKFPLLIHRNELVEDTEGAGEWRGTPGAIVEFGPRQDPMTVAYISNTCEFPPAGVLGGEPGSRTRIHKTNDDNERISVPNIGYDVVQPDEVMVCVTAGGGGYGEPTARDPESVLKDVTEELVSREKAREAYGVVLTETDDGLVVDSDATEARRAALAEEEDR